MVTRVSGLRELGYVLQTLKGNKIIETPGLHQDKIHLQFLQKRYLGKGHQI